MRLLRIELTSFRGVEHSVVELAEEGVTIVEGPNEIGKSSLAEAIELLFSEPDSSTKRAVRAVEPVDRDEGPEVRVELVTGPYHVLYAKRWRRRPMTELEVRLPVPERAVGREAHDRMEAILDETLDVALWRALRLQQGHEIAQADVGGSLSLGRALDRASGSSATSDGSEETLFERVNQERLRYQTATGRATNEDVRLDEERSSCAEEIAALEADILAIDDAAEEIAVIKAEHLALEGERAAQLADRRLLEERWDAIEQIRQQRDGLVAAATAARFALEMARGALADREALVEESRRADEVAAQTKGPGDADEVFERALRAEGDAQERVDEATQQLEAMRGRAQRARGDAEHLRQVSRLAHLAERVERVRDAVVIEREAREALDRAQIDDEALEELAGVQAALGLALARQEAESPHVIIEAVADVDLELDGSPQRIESGSVLELPSGVEMTIGFPELATIRLVGGSSASERAAAVADARQARDRAFVAVGIDPDGDDDPLEVARAQVVQRRHAERQLGLVEQTLRDNLEGLSPDALEDEHERVSAEVGGYRTVRDDAHGPMPETREEAKALVDSAEDAVVELERERSAQLTLLETARREVADLRVEAARLEEQRSAAEDRRAAAARALADARAALDDAALGEAVHAAEGELRICDERTRLADRQLEEADPEVIHARLENARAVVVRVESEIDALRERERDLQALINVRSEGGLHERLDAARSRAAVLEQRRAQRDRQAAAAVLLYETMARHRDEAKRSYVGPLKERIEGLGRFIFGPTLSVELDPESLTITSRTVDGITVGFESLSGGAKEQLGMVARLACAQLVAQQEDDAVPVLIDDALGYSDAERLRAMGAVLSQASRAGQVIVLTCAPERYRSVGNAHVVSLRSRSTDPQAESPVD